MYQFIIGLLVGGICFGGFAYFFASKKAASQNEHAKKEAENILSGAETRAAEIVKRAEERREEEYRKIETERAELKERQKKMEELEVRITEKDDRIDKKLEELDKRQETLREREREISELKTKEEKLAEELRNKLSEVAKMSEDEAKTLLIAQVEARYEKDILGLMEKKKGELRIREKELSQEILVKSIQQYAGDVTAEMTQTMIKLESDDLKGKLIGKE